MQIYQKKATKKPEFKVNYFYYIYLGTAIHAYINTHAASSPINNITQKKKGNAFFTFMSVLGAMVNQQHTHIPIAVWDFTIL